MVKITATVQLQGINPYVLVISRQAERLKAGWRKPLPVLLRVNGLPEVPWRTNMMPAGNGDFYLYLHGAMRQAAATKVGDTVIIDIEFDTEYRNGPLHDMPAWFSDALDHQPRAQRNWDKLSPSRQKEILRYFAGLKSAETQNRNLQRALSVLSGNPGRFMGRAWRDGL